MSEWISVRDRLPEHNQVVWYYFDIAGVTAGRYDAKDGCFYNSGGWSRGDATHWQPCDRPHPPEDKL